MISSFCFCLLAFLLIGLSSTVKNRHTTVDYLVTGHDTSPWVVALSAVATNNSGYMFVGMIGYTVSVGLGSIWLLIGWILGDLAVSFIVHRRMRHISETKNQVSYGGVLGAMISGPSVIVARLAGFITLLFLATYAAAQLSAGGKALQVLFGWDFSIGALIGAVAVLLYCFAGGIRASFWTDIAQSFVMIVAMLVLVIIGMSQLGGWNGFVQELHGLEPGYLGWFPKGIEGANLIALFLIGWFAAGVGVVGQPHIMLRFLALDSEQHLSRVRVYYYSWYILFSTVTIIVGMLARLLLPDVQTIDAELALPKLALQLLNPAFAGLVLAGLFAATMSTADSQIMACSASLTHDFRADWSPSYFVVKGATLAIAAVALAIALWGPRSVFQLVLISWSSLGAAFAPVVLLACFGLQVQQKTAVLMIISGLCGVVWGRAYLPGIYEILPGVSASLVIYAAQAAVCRLRLLRR